MDQNESQAGYRGAYPLPDLREILLQLPVMIIINTRLNMSSNGSLSQENILFLSDGLRFVELLCLLWAKNEGYKVYGW
jgi:hypothetical protein